MADPKGMDIAIVGGGLGGVILTLALLRRGVTSVRIYERAAAFGEYGAGLTLHATTVEAMRACDPRVAAALEAVANRPTAGGKPDVFMQMVDGTDGGNAAPITATSPPAARYTHRWDGVAAAAHRGHLLDALVKNLPDGVAQLGRQLVAIDDHGDGPCTLKFEDGSEATADLVVGFDGIGSHVRRHIVGADHPSARAGYSHQFIYRMLVPIHHGIELLGEEQAKTGTIWCGHGNRVITFPIAGGRMLNMSLVVRDPSEWPEAHTLVVPATKAEVLAGASGLSPTLQALLGRAMDNVDKWGIFDLADAPPPAFAKGRVCIGGDAAHAAGPHLGAGAGFAIEDAAVLATILSDDRVVAAGADRSTVEAALLAYQDVRMPRTQALPPAARRAGELIVYSAEGVGDDWPKLTAEMAELGKVAWDYSVEKMVQDAKEALDKRLEAVQK